MFLPSAGKAMPTEINDGDRFVSSFTQFASDGGLERHLRRGPDDLRLQLSHEPYPTDFGETRTMVMACEDVPVYADGVASTAPEDVYSYSETWSLELGMPVTQSFDIDPKTGAADSVSRLVDFDLR